MSRQSLCLIEDNLKQFLVILFFLRIIAGITKLFHVVKETVFTGAIMSMFVRISGKCCSFSFISTAMPVARCFSKTVLAFSGRLSSTLILTTPIFGIA